MYGSVKGFTLVELIVAVIIIGILASIAAPMISNMKTKSICTEAVATMGMIRAALRTYRIEHQGRNVADGVLRLRRLRYQYGSLLSHISFCFYPEARRSLMRCFES